MAVPADALRAARRYGSLVDPIAAAYRNPVTGGHLSGAALLLKLAKGESGFRPDQVSRAGARGETQFTPGSRKAVLSKFGIDPWRSTDEAFHAAALHLLGHVNGKQGLEGYNPGDSSYPAYILGQHVGGPGASSKSTGASSALLTASSGPATVPQGSTGLAPLLEALQAPRQQQASAGLQSPAFSAQPRLAAGAQIPASGGGLAAKPDVASLLAAIQTAGGDVPGASQTGLSGSVTASGASSGGKGRVTVAPGADRAGVKTKPAVLNFVDRVSALAGEPLTIGTGSHHSRLTVNGTVSDHWSGNAADVPARGKNLIKLGQDALIAAGMSPARARKIKGGGFNVGDYQVIFNTDAPGWGDHLTHLHVGIRR